MALKQGMSNEEISSFLNGDNTFIKPEEAKAIIFAQHFADATGTPQQYAYDAIVKEYGEKSADIIISATQLILAGNMYGIPYSAFLSRMHGKPYKNSTLFYELAMLLSGLLFLPIASIHGAMRVLMGLPNKKFDNSAAVE